MEATTEAEARWVGAFDRQAAKRANRGFGGGNDCTPSYYNNEGQRDPANARSGPYPMAPRRSSSSWLTGAGRALWRAWTSPANEAALADGLEMPDLVARDMDVPRCERGEAQARALVFQRPSDRSPACTADVQVGGSPSPVGHWEGLGRGEQAKTQQRDRHPDHHTHHHIGGRLHPEVHARNGYQRHHRRRHPLAGLTPATLGH